MSHSDIIIITGTLLFSSTVGVYAIIRYIKLHTIPPVNRLTRSGDIELQEIDPIQHINVRDIDLSSLPQYPQSMVNNHLPIRWDNPPRYSQLSNNFINSPLELDSWDFISWLIFLGILIAFIIIILKYFKTKLLILTLFCFIFGLSMNSLYVESIIIPFSFFDIDFRDSFVWKFNSYRDKPKISYLKLQSMSNDINLLLLSLADDENYSMSLSFISSYKEWELDKRKIHPLFIDDAIIINKESDHLLITQFIMENLNKKGYFITDWLFKDFSINLMDPVILTVTVPIKVEI